MEFYMKYFIMLCTFIFSISAISANANNVKRNPLILTCDFTTDSYYVIVDYPKSCASDINKHKSVIERDLKVANTRFLSAEILFLANPPACPKGYKDLDIKQGGRTSSGHANHTNLYQVRRICL